MGETPTLDLSAYGHLLTRVVGEITRLERWNARRKLQDELVPRTAVGSIILTRGLRDMLSPTPHLIDVYVITTSPRL